MIHPQDSLAFGQEIEVYASCLPECGELDGKLVCKVIKPLNQNDNVMRAQSSRLSHSSAISDLPRGKDEPRRC